MQNPGVTQSLITLLITAFLVYRIATRELRPRVVKGGVIWIRPLILVALTVAFAVLSVFVDPTGNNLLIGAVVAGVVVGAIAGILIARETTFGPAGIANAVVANGSRVTFAIWIVAFVIRLLARFAVPHGADPHSQLPMNTGTIALLAAATLVIAYVFHRAIDRHREAPAAVAAP